MKIKHLKLIIFTLAVLSLPFAFRQRNLTLLPADLARETVSKPATSKANIKSSLEPGSKPKLEPSASTISKKPAVKKEIEISLTPGAKVYPGDVLMVEIKNDETNRLKSLRAGDKTFRPAYYRDKKVILIPINSYSQPQKLKLTTDFWEKEIAILPAQFEKIAITLPKIVSSRKEEKIYQQEREQILAAYSQTADGLLFQAPFQMPLDKIEVTSPFGETRIDKSKDFKSVHNGIDFRAKAGTPIMAVNDGVVRLADNFLAEGKFAIIDHGAGISSVYLHLSRLNVKTGDKVRRGQVIGLSGQSGQAIGPHLHFMVKINGVAVDPLKFFQLWQ